MSGQVSGRPLAGRERLAQRVCVLVGSMGGVAGLRRFFQSIPGALPVAFIVTLPINPDAVPLLCDFIARNTRMRVLPALSGHLLRHGEIVVMPADRLMAVDEVGRINLVVPASKPLNPIDVMMKVLARHFRGNAGAIIFSGIGEDGQRGCRSIVEHGGEVWTQCAESCQFDSLPRYVSEGCEVKFTSTPENLAARLQQELAAIKRHRPESIAAH